MTNKDREESLTVEEGNKLIAEFCGYQFAGDGKSMYFNITKPGEGHWYFGAWFIKDFNDHLAEKFNYHSSWDKLMPVVEKIESTHDDYHGYFGVYISSNGCSVQGTKFRPDSEFYHPAYFDQKTCKSKIQATYKAIVAFIQWYNNQNKNPLP